MAGNSQLRTLASLVSEKSNLTLPDMNDRGFTRRVYQICDRIIQPTQPRLTGTLFLLAQRGRSFSPVSLILVRNFCPLLPCSLVTTDGLFLPTCTRQVFPVQPPDKTIPNPPHKPYPHIKSHDGL